MGSGDNKESDLLGDHLEAAAKVMTPEEHGRLLAIDNTIEFLELVMDANASDVDSHAPFGQSMVVLTRAMCSLLSVRHHYLAYTVYKSSQVARNKALDGLRCVVGTTSYAIKMNAGMVPWSKALLPGRCIASLLDEVHRHGVEEVAGLSTHSDLVIAMGDPHQGNESQVQLQDHADGSVATNDSAAARSPPLQRAPSFPWASTNERVQVEAAVETQRVGPTIVYALQYITGSDGRFASMYSGRQSDTLLLGHVFEPLTQWIYNRLKWGEVERQRDIFAYVL